MLTKEEEYDLILLLEEESRERKIPEKKVIEGVIFENYCSHFGPDLIDVEKSWTPRPLIAAGVRRITSELRGYQGKRVRITIEEVE